MTVFNFTPHAIKIIACASGAGSIVLMGRRSRCLPSQGHSLGEGTSSGLTSRTVLLCAVPGWELEPAGGSPVQLGAGELAPLLSLFLAGVDLRNPGGIPQQIRIIRGVTRS